MGANGKLSLFLTGCFLLFTNSAFAATPQLEAESCSTTEECQLFVEGSTCDSATCKCPQDTIQSSDGTKCLAIVKTYGSACEETVQCSAGLNAGGVCLSNVCTCKIGYHYLKGGCWKNVGLGETCTTSEQCYAAYDFVGFECSDTGLCQCREQYYERAGACRRKRTVGEDCALDSDCKCSGGDGTCATRACTCPGSFEAYTSPTVLEVKLPLSQLTHKAGENCDPGYFPCISGNCTGTCVPELGTGCTSTDDTCADGVAYATCIDELMCGCQGSLRAGSANNRVCNKVIPTINGTCSDSGQCGAFGASASCDENQCVCSKDSHYDAKTLFCRSSKYVGEGCDVDEDCVTVSGDNVACTSGLCACVAGSHQANGNLDCRPDAIRVGDKCTEDSDCSSINYSLCNTTSSVCQCAEHFIPDATGICVEGLGSSCASSSECSYVANAFCDQSICNCTEEFVASSDYKTCLKVNGYNGECVEDKQCDPILGDLKICSDGKCDCQTGSQFILSKCYAMKQLGEKCGARAECIPPGGELDAYMCQNAICACQYGYKRNGNICEPV